MTPPDISFERGSCGPREERLRNFIQTGSAVASTHHGQRTRRRRTRGKWAETSPLQSGRKPRHQHDDGDFSHATTGGAEYPQAGRRPAPGTSAGLLCRTERRFLVGPKGRRDTTSRKKSHRLGDGPKTFDKAGLSSQVLVMSIHLMPDAGSRRASIQNMRPNRQGESFPTILCYHQPETPASTLSPV